VSIWFKVAFGAAILIRGLMSDEEWACLEPFVIERGARSGRRSRDHLLVLDSGSGSWPLKRWLYDQDPSPHHALGLPIAFALSGGEVSDYKGYVPIMNADGPAPKVLLADKGYDADFIREDIEQRGGVAMIPTKQPLDPAARRCRDLRPAQHG